MSSSADRAGPDAMTRPWRSYSGWMQAIFPAVCSACAEPITEGTWQGMARVPEEGVRWVHEQCALRLGPLGDPQRPEHDRGVAPEPAPAPAPPPEPLRILVLGSVAWPRDRAVEVRDGIAAVARGHAQVVLIHAARVHPETGRLAGVDAWAELTAQRLGYAVEHHGIDPTRHDQNTCRRRHDALIATGPDVVVAFPLEDDPATADAIARAGHAGLPVLTHIP